MVALVLPRLGVGREVIGEWESLLYVGYILGFGWLTGLLQGYLVSVRLSRPAEADAFSRRAVLGVGLFSALLLAVAAGLHEPLFRLLRLGEAPFGWWYFFLFLLTQWPGLFFEQVLLIRGKPVALMVFSGLSALGFLLSLLLPIWHGAGLAHALFVLAAFAGVKGLVIAGWLLRGYPRPSPASNVSNDGNQISNIAYRISHISHASETSNDGTKRPKNQQTKRLLRTSLPLILYASVGALVTAFDPWFVNYWYAGDEAVFATFRYGARELPLLAAVTNGLIITVLPRLTEDRAAGLDLLKTESRKLFHWVFGGAIGLMVTSPWWWTAVFTGVFAESLPLFQVYLLIVVSRMLFPTPVLTALGHTRLLAPIAISELATNLLLSIWFVSLFGITGIIWATVLADILNKGVLMAYLVYRRQIMPGRYIDLKTFLAYTAGLSLAYFAVRSFPIF